MTTPEGLRYTSAHEWVRPPAAGEASVRVGITDYAQEQLGDIVYVSLPAAGSEVVAGASCGELESTKSVSDLFAPVSGTVVAGNEALVAAPELANADPYGEGWMIDIRPSDPGEVDQLLDAAAYEALLSNS